MLHLLISRVIAWVVLSSFVLFLAACSDAGRQAATSKNDPNPTVVIDAKVSGLTGTVELKTGTGETIVVSGNQAFSLPASAANQVSSLAIAIQPLGQTCTVTLGSATAQGIIKDISVDCVANTYAIGGNVSGLVGSLTVQNNNAESLIVTANASYSFATKIPHGDAYEAVIVSQPQGQVCALENPTGTALSTVENIAIYCQNLSGNTNNIIGTVSGLRGTVVLQERNGEKSSLTTNGAFTLPPFSLLGEAGNYSLSIFTQPVGQICILSNGTGTFSSHEATSLTVTCATNAYAIGGTASGLRNTIVLQNNGIDNLSVSTSGDFSFGRAIVHGGTFSVTVLNQPNGQVCSVERGTGFATDIVSTVRVSCVDTYTVGGTIDGLTGTVVLQNNNGDNLPVSVNGAFAFTQAWPTGTYAVTVFAHPAGQVCETSNNNGTIEGAHVTSIRVTCTARTYEIGGTITGLVGTLELQNNGRDTLARNESGPMVFASRIAHRNDYSVTISKQPATQLCTIVNAAGTVTANVGNIAISCANTFTVGGTVVGLTATSGSLVLQNRNGDSATVASNGNFTFPIRVAASQYAVTVSTQPVGQTCTINNATGAVVDANITQIAVTCTANTYTVGGTVSGLSGTLVVQNNGGGNLQISANGVYQFVSRVAYGNPYAVSVLTQPTGQTCTVSSPSGTATANVTRADIICTGNQYTLGGNLSGLVGNVTLRNSNGDSLALATNGTFQFAIPVTHGATYAVTVSTQPATQSCTVVNGAGAAAANVSQISVNCALRTYTIGGTISGLIGSIVLRNNGGDNHSVITNGDFSFSTPISHGSTYAVTVFTQPVGQVCTVTNGSGAATATVSTVGVTCVTNTYPIGGTITGLNGSVTLRNNGGNDLNASANGAFTFSTKIPHGSTYAITVLTQPTGQTCTIANGGGTATVAVTTVGVSCTTNTYTIGGTITGLSGTIVLRNNGGNDLSLNANGGFTFTTKLAYGSGYSASIFTQPTGQTCLPNFSTGTVTNTVTQITVTCTSLPPVLSLSSDIKQFRFSWTAMAGATYYKLMANPNGGAGYTQVGAVISATSAATVRIDVAVHRYNWGKGSYLVSGCNAANVCSDSNVVFPLSESLKTIGYVKASNTGPGDNLGFSLVLSGDGNTLAVGAPFEDSGTLDATNTPNELMADAGAVYIYAKNANGWVQLSYLKAPNPYINSRFGTSISLSRAGDTIAIGANFEDSDGAGTPNGGAGDSGAVYVFTRSGAAWTQRAFVKASNVGIGDEFGRSVSLSADGNTLAVGSPLEDGSVSVTPNELAIDAGAAYVYVRNTTTGTWGTGTYLKASSPGTRDQFGSSISLSADGTTLVVGAPTEDSDSAGTLAIPNELAANSGAAYVFTRVASTWTLQALVKASNAGSGDAFGTSVSLASDGNTLAVGAPAEASSTSGIDGVPNETAVGAGAVYVYSRLTGAWSQKAFIKASNPGANDAFGTQVALASDGNTLAVGAPGEDSNLIGINGLPNETGSNSGAAYLFSRGAITWSSLALVKAPNTDAGDSFGGSITLSDNGNALGVGAKSENGNGVGLAGDRTNNTAAFAGAAYLY